MRIMVWLCLMMMVLGETVGCAATTGSAVWTREAWGELGVAPMGHGMFPDDSRASGFKSGSGEFPFAGHYDDGSAAFCVPAGFEPGPRVDFVVVLHGHRNQCARFVRENRIGPILAESGLNAILIVPQGPKDAPDSGGGKFEKPGGFSAFMGEAMTTLKREGRVPTGARLGSVALCGYSGGGRPVGFILRNGDLAPNLAEVWLMDACYQQHDGLAAPFLKPGGSTRLRSVFTDGLWLENLQIAGRLARAGRPVAVAVDDDLTTPGSAPGARDELRGLLGRHDVMFVRTALPHDAFLLTRRFLPPLLGECRFGRGPRPAAR